MGGGLWGCRPGQISIPAERRSWREGCLRTGALTARTSAKVRISSQRNSEAAGWDTRRSYISMNRAVGAEGLAGDGGDPFAEGHAPAGNGKWGGFEYNCSCVLSGKHSFMPTEPRSLRSLCRVCRSDCITCHQASSRQREAKNLTPERVPFTVTWSARAAAVRVTGDSRQTGCGV
jgi:hypothetical protein